MTSQERAQALSDQIGEKVTLIQEPQFDAIMQAGVTCKLHIGRWRAEKRRSLSDMGVILGDIEEETAWNGFLDAGDLGAMKLLPVKMVKSMNSKENAARSALRASGINTRWGVFLPIGRVPEWLESDRRREADYLGFRDEIRENYETIRENARQAYQDAARGVYRREKGLDATSTPWVPLAYREEYAERCMLGFASKDDLVASITWTREFGFLPLPSLLAQEQAERTRVLAEAKLTDEQYRLLETLNAEAARDAYAKKSQMVDGFLADVRKELHTRILEATADVLAALQKNGRLPNQSIAQVRNLVATIDGLNLLDDQEITQAMNDLKGRVGAASGEVGVVELTRTLRQINQTARDTLTEINQATRPTRIAAPLNLTDAPDLNGKAREMRAQETLDLGVVLPTASRSF